jgi:hypothetical protein
MYNLFYRNLNGAPRAAMIIIVIATYGLISVGHIIAITVPSKMAQTRVHMIARAGAAKSSRESDKAPAIKHAKITPLSVFNKSQNSDIFV